MAITLRTLPIRMSIGSSGLIDVGTLDLDADYDGSENAFNIGKVDLAAALREAAATLDPKPVDAERIAAAFHAAYEALAPSKGYETRKASAVPWADVPEQNRQLMIATVETLLAKGVITGGPAEA